MNIFDDRIQITPADKDKTAEINEYLLLNPEKVLRLYWFEKSNEFTFLNKIKKVEKISVSYSTLTDLRFLENFPNLKYLDINETTGKVDISVLKNLVLLEIINLGFQKITNQNDLNNLSNLQNLKELYFSGKFKKKSLSLINFKNLEILGPQIKDIDLSQAEQLTNLKSLQLINQKIDSLNSIENLKSLKSVLLNNIKIDNQDLLSNIFHIENIETLSIFYVKTITDFNFIKNKSNLKNLYLWSLNGLETLSGLEKLISLEKYSQCGDHKNKNTIDFSLLQQLQTLKEVEIKVGTMNAEAKQKLETILDSIRK